MWLNLYILIFIILSFFSPTFNHTQRLPFLRHRLAGWLQVQIAPSSSSIAVSVIPEGVAQEVQALAALLQVQHASLFAVDMQPQPSFQFAFDPSPQLWADIAGMDRRQTGDRKSTRLNSSHVSISYAVFC